MAECIIGSALPQARGVHRLSGMTALRVLS